MTAPRNAGPARTAATHTVRGASEEAAPRHAPGQRLGALPVLQACGISAGYSTQAVIHDINIEVHPGEVVALLGPNGAGKTTNLLVLAGELPPMSGEVRLDGNPTQEPLFRRARRGVGFVTEEKSVFMGMSATDNMRIGKINIPQALALFPELEKRMSVRGGLLSGGEQQMLTLARALGRGPRVLLIDELSLGLAPLVVRRLLSAIRQAADRGCAVILVEQHVRQALQIADHGYVMRRGNIVLQGTSTELIERLSEIEASYLNTTG